VPHTELIKNAITNKAGRFGENGKKTKIDLLNLGTV
jgi:hypothetical protein